MSNRIAELLGEIDRILSDLPDVFSTAQWGGRAYKLPNPNGDRSKPKLLAFVVVARDGDAVSVGFKLDRQRAPNVIEQYKWVAPDSAADPIARRVDSVMSQIRAEGWSPPADDDVFDC